MFGFGKKKAEARAVQTTQSASDFFAALGIGFQSSTGQTVNTTTAMGVPAVFAAVNFISGTIAGLPLHVYQRTEEGRDRVKGPISGLLHDAVNDETTSYDWRKYKFDRVLTGGRGITQIVRNGRGEVGALIPLDPTKVKITRINGLKLYEYKEDDRVIRLEASDVIDIPFMLKDDMVGHIGPISANADAIGLALAVQDHAAKFFQNGGVPPFAVTGNFQSGASLNRAADDLYAAVKKAAAEQRQALTLPAGLEIKQIGTDAEKSQLLETQRFCVEQIARVYSLPPVFLQDLTHGTFSNTEQQDLHFVKHTLKRWVEQFEQEMNLKLFGRKNNKYFVEFSMDGLLRGDFKTRMEGYAAGVQNALITPNEVRDMENRPKMANGDTLLIQGATVPLGSQPVAGEGDGNAA